MSRAVATIEPTSIQAGDSVEWNKVLQQFSAVDWTLTYYFIPRTAEQGGTTITPVVATAASGDFEIRITAATTAQWLAGTYTMVGYVSDADERFEVYRAQLTIVPDLATATAHDNRTYLQRLLEKIETVLEEGVIRDIIEYQWGGMQVKIMSIKDALDARDRIQGMVTQESASGRQGKILTRFRGYR